MATQDKEGQWWCAQDYQQHAAFVPVLGSAVLDLLSAQKQERILDLGCGDGVLTEILVKTGAKVIGVDMSLDQVQAAKAKGLNVLQADAQNLPFYSEFDAVFSNAALHWMKEADQVIASVKNALKPKGRFVAEFGGYMNVAAIVTALMAALDKQNIDGTQLNPWYFPTLAEYRSKLEAQNFHVSYIELIARPTPLKTGIDGWLKTFCAPFVQSLPKERQKIVLTDVKRFLSPALQDSQGDWTADYMRLRFQANLC